MQRVVACFKWVMDDADIRVNETSRSLDFSKVKPKISEYDRNAIEAAVQLKKDTGCEVVGLTVGSGLKGALKDALSRGLDRVVYVDDPSLKDAGAGTTAKTLAEAIRSLGQVDAVVCGEGSSDQYHQQTGPRLAAMLDMISVSCVSAMETGAGGLKLTRKLDDCQEVAEVSGPVVLSVMPDLNEAPIPSLKQILAAKKKPSEQLEPGGTAQARLAPQSLLSPVVDRKRINLTAGGVSVQDAALDLVNKLTQENILD
jgi:electron transfer flavoprotein beta subunit